MSHRHRILVVAQQPKVAERVTSWVRTAGHHVSLETTFADGRAGLETTPDVLFAEVKLGEYNGLHLALRARARGIPAIISGPLDPVLAHEAAAVGAIYLEGPLSRTRVLEALARQLPAASTGTSHSMHWPVTTIAAEAETLWRAFSEASWPQPLGLTRRSLPN